MSQTQRGVSWLSPSKEQYARLPVLVPSCAFRRDLEAAEDRRGSGAGARMRRRTQQHRKLVGRERASVEPSLCERAAHLQQQALLLSGFDALRKGYQAEAVAEADDGGDNLPAVRPHDHLLDEAAIHFDLVEGQRHEVAKAGIAGAEVVDGQSAAHSFDFLSDAQGLILIVENGALGDLNDQPVERDAGENRGLAQLRGQASVTKLDGRDIEGDAEMARQDRGGAEGLAQDLAREDADNAEFFGDLNEVAGQNQAETRMAPAREHLESGQA